VGGFESQGECDKDFFGQYYGSLTEKRRAGPAKKVKQERYDLSGGKKKSKGLNEGRNFCKRVEIEEAKKKTE